jgi:D-3-phosphoglycerate dehydrogenase
MSDRLMLVIDTTGRSDYPPEALAHLEGLSVRIEPAKAVQEDDVIAAARGATAILVTAAYVTRRVQEALQPELRTVVRYGVGLDRIDLDAAREIGIEVRNTTDFCTNEVADQSLALIMALSRRICIHANAVREGNWGRRGEGPILRLSGRRAGVIGFGAIGRAVCRRLQAVGMEVVSHDPYADEAAARAVDVALVPMEELVATSHVISVNCPLNDETRGLIGAGEFAAMAPGTLIVNTGRGGIIDENALVEALRSGMVAGAGLDVLEQEPPPADHPLLAMENVIITPHMAASSQEAMEELVLGVFRNLGEALRATQ